MKKQPLNNTQLPSKIKIASFSAYTAVKYGTRQFCGPPNNFILHVFFYHIACLFDKGLFINVIEIKANTSSSKRKILSH
jgi:hypothetical protein